MGIKKRLSILAVAVVSIFFLTGISPLFAQQSETDMELWAYILRQGKRAYEQYLGTHGEVNPGDWGIPIEAAFLKLASSSGEKGADLYYAITADDNFNAMCFPGGDFVIHSGALKILDSMIESQLDQPLSKIDPVRLQVTRETLLAPVIAHELGHYYNRHAFHSFNRIWNMAAQNRQDIDLTMISYTQYQEFEADNTGYLLLKRANYDPDSMLFILELLNAIHQDALKQAPANALNVYLSTHPSPHARLATFQRGQQKLHKWAASLEQAFSDIQLGRNLSSALSAIENSFYTVPGNLYLLKAKAVALHKLWLETVTLKDQKLRAIIDLPSFRDDMVFSDLGSRAVRKQIPGDRKMWLQAKKAYEDSSTDAVDPGYYSNFAVLLAYSPEPEDEELAGQLAGTAAMTEASMANLSNLAFVFYHTGQKEKALQLFAELATEYNKSYTSFLQAAVSDPVVVGNLQAFRQQMKLIQQLNSEYVHGEFTPVLNFALCLYYEERKNLSIQVAKDYLDRYESSSLWADYLSKTTGVGIPEQPAKSYMAVKGLKVGQTLKDVLRLWGKADEITAYDEGHEMWYFDKLKASVYIQGGIVDVIELTSPESPKIEDRIGVGSSQQEIEQEYGKHKRTADKMLIYEGRQNLAVLYARSVAAGIVLFQ